MQRRPIYLIRPALVALLALVVGAAAPAVAERPVLDRGAVGNFPVSASRTIAFRDGLSLDLWRQPRRPLVVFVHGGGWAAGSRAIAGRMAGALNSLGYALAAMDYRKVPHVDVLTSVADVAAAIEFLHQKFGCDSFDPSRLFVMGHSAGAHLAALAAGDLVRTGIVKGIVLLDPVGLDMQRTITRQPGIGKRIGITSHQARAISPMAQITARGGPGAPTLVLAGPDHRETAAQGEEYARKLIAAGGTGTFKYMDLDHTAFVRDLSRSDSGLSREVATFLRSILAELPQSTQKCP